MRHIFTMKLSQSVWKITRWLDWNRNWYEEEIFLPPTSTYIYIYFFFKLIRGLVSVNVVVCNEDLTRSNHSSFSSSTITAKLLQLDDRLLATRSSGNASTIRKVYSGRFILNRYPISALPRIFNRGPHPSLVDYFLA